MATTDKAAAKADPVAEAKPVPATPPTDAQLMLAELKFANKLLERIATAMEAQNKSVDKIAVGVSEAAAAAPPIRG